MSVHRPSPIAEIGRRGRLRIEYARRDSHTIIARSHCASPWHLFPPIYLDDSGAAYTLLLNPSGGLVGGDHLKIDLVVRPKAHAIISTPSANRVYRSLYACAVQAINVTIEADGLLEWFPEPTIPFAGSRYRQAIHVRLAPGATVVLWDAIASGRVAQDERWAFASLANLITITTASGGSVTERFRLDHVRDSTPGGIARSWDYVASLYIVSDAINADVWKILETRLNDVLDAEPGGLLGGVSTPAVPGVVVKLVARSAPMLNAAREQLWAAVRFTLWGLPPMALRKY